MEPKIPHPTHKCPQSVPILSQLHSVPTTLSNFLKIHLNIILPSTSWSPQWPLSLRLPHQHPVHPYILLHTRQMPCPSHSSRFYHPHNIGNEYRSFSSSLCSFLHSPVTSSRIVQILSPTTYSQTPSACVPPSVSATKFHNHTKPQAKL